MIFAFLDEFGHNGPFVAKSHPSYNTSPVFGLAGYLMPEQEIRGFGTYFLQRKTDLLGPDIVASGKHPYEWEKKGTNLFTAKSIEKYPNIRDSMFRMISQVKKRNAKLFYYGREKIRGEEKLNPNGLYTTVFAHAIRQIDAYCDQVGQNFAIVIDENSARRELLETAAKTMFGMKPARRLISPPFEVESHLSQNIQAADWIASITGRLWNHELDPDGFGAYEPYRRYFWDRVHAAATHSTVMKRPVVKKKRAAPTPKLGSFGEILQEARSKSISATVVERITEVSVRIESVDHDTDGLDD